MRHALELLELASALILMVVGVTLVIGVLVGTVYVVAQSTAGAGCCALWFVVPGLALVVLAVGGMVRPLDPAEHER